jgi:pyruvate/2-oxoglutarate dehydrogenase complex dihydrolipoamide dehydrogenase (E3) component
MASNGYDYDLIILGGGSAGIAAGIVAGQAGLRTLLIEKEKMGGECLNTGCVPSKTLLEAARVAHQMKHAERYGLQPTPLTREQAAGVLRHIRETVSAVEEADGITEHLQQNGVEVRFGDAAFISPDAIEIVERGGNAQALTAEHFLLATGSSPARPTIPGLEETGFLTSEDIFGLEEIPETLTVIGGDSIGVEMAQGFARLGSQVTLIEATDRLLPHDDLEAAKALEEALRLEGIDLRLNTEVTGAQLEGSRKVARLEHEGMGAHLSGRHMLVTVGRTPNVDGLNLQAAGVEYDQNGVHVSPTLRTTGPRVWACGDVTGRYQFSHMAEFEARLVVRNILFPFDRKADSGFRLAPWATFTDPEVAHVGLTEEEAKAQGIEYQVYKQPFAQNDRALAAGEGVGFVKVLTTGWQGKVIGAHIVGPHAGELIQEWITTMTQGLTLRQVADTIHVYPTLSTANQRAAHRWQEAQARRPIVKKAVTTYTQTVRPNLGRMLWTFAGAAVAGAAVATATKKRRAA